MLQSLKEIVYVTRKSQAVGFSCVDTCVCVCVCVCVCGELNPGA